MSVYRKEIRAWPKIKSGDADGFQKFFNFLVKCESIMSKEAWNPLDTRCSCPNVLEIYETNGFVK